MAESRALIVENGLGCVLPAARSLARAGWSVGLGAPMPNPRECGSRAVTYRHEVPRPELTLDGFASAVADAVEQVGYDLLFPADDAVLLALSATRDRLGAIVPVAPHTSVLRAIDKLELTEAARATGLAVPRTELATEAAIAACALPVMVKPRLQWTPGSDAGIGELFVRRGDDHDAVRRQVGEIEAAGIGALLQEPVIGRQIAVSMVVDRDGRMAAASQQTTLRYSLSGTSTRAVTLEADRALLERVRELLRHLNWFGLANLQFLQPEGGAPHLIDLNGRFYGSLALAIAAGADLPLIWAGCATGHVPAEPAIARGGVRFHALETDLVRARTERRGGLLRDVVQTVAFAPAAAHTLWSARDPAPAFRWTGALARRLTRRLLRRARHGATTDQ